MKRISVFVVGFLSVAQISFAQTFSNFGIIGDEERSLKECEFDKEAEAVYLLHEAVSNYNDNYNLITDHHVRIKILKEKGIEYGNIVIPFYSSNDFEYITDIEGIVINYDESGKSSIQRLDRKSIFTKKTTKYHSEMRFAFPAVKTGSIIDYTYRSTMKHYGGLDDWTFQEELPVYKSTYSLTIIPNYEFSYLFSKSPNLPAEVKNDPQSGRIYFAMKNIPGLRDEPYMDARKDYLQRVTFQLAAHNEVSSSGYSTTTSNRTKYNSSWQQVIQELMSSSSFGNQLNKKLDDTDDFIKQVKTVAADVEKVKLVFNYVRSNMSWNRIGSISSPDGIKGAWNKRSGTNGEINLILVNLLKETGLEAWPLLVSERKNGRINKDYPSVDHFNTVYAYVAAGNKKYYLDANDKFTPAGIIPHAILNTTALLVNKKIGGLITISDEESLFRETVFVNANITDDKKINGNAFLSSRDYARVVRLKDYLADKKNYAVQKFQKYIPGVHIDSFVVENEQADSLDLKQQFFFESPLQQTGDYFLLPVNIFTGFESNPFVAANRFANINFGYRQSVNLTAVINLPQTLIVDALPNSLKLTNEDNTITFTRQIVKDEAINALSYRISIELKKSLYTPDEYGPVKEFYKKMFSLLNEQIVLKKKN